MQPADRPPIRTFKPRRRALSPSRQQLFERLAERWVLDEQGPVLDLDEVFGRRAPTVLEIGIGAGEALVQMAVAQPEFDVIGTDVHTPGIAAVLEGIEGERLENVRLMHGDVLEFLPRIALAALHGIRIFFPDPWPKARQQHRRLVRRGPIGALVDRLEPGGWLHLATDIDDYAAQMRAVCDEHPRLSGGVIERPSWRPVTRYEEKGHAAGRTATDLWYVAA